VAGRKPGLPGVAQWEADLRETVVDSPGLLLAWHALVQRRESAYVTWHCTRCAIPEDFRVVRAIYRWVWGVDPYAEERLCEECCAWMRQHYRPLRIESLSPPDAKRVSQTS
jgi:hypothetical protein